MSLFPTTELAAKLAEDFERRKLGKQTTYDKVVAMIGAGMGIETRLPVGNQAVEAIEKQQELLKALTTQISSDSALLRAVSSASRRIIRR